MAVLAGFTMTLLYGGHLALAGELGVGSYSALVYLTQRLLWPLTRLADMTDLYQRSMASVQRVMDLLETPVPETEITATCPPPGGARSRSVRFVPGLADGADEPVLNGVSFVVPAGTTTALVGATAPARARCSASPRSAPRRRGAGALLAGSTTTIAGYRRSAEDRSDEAFAPMAVTVRLADDLDASPRRPHLPPGERPALGPRTSTPWSAGWPMSRRARGSRIAIKHTTRTVRGYGQGSRSTGAIRAPGSGRPSRPRRRGRSRCRWRSAIASSDRVDAHDRQHGAVDRLAQHAHLVRDAGEHRGRVEGARVAARRAAGPPQCSSRPARPPRRPASLHVLAARRAEASGPTCVRGSAGSPTRSARRRAHERRRGSARSTSRAT